VSDSQALFAAALYLPGINDGYCGAAPDLGALEHCPERPAERSRPQH
jgi:hypothetical protein